jgi:hypothetical protein
MKKLVVALFLVLGFYMMSPNLKLGVSTAFAQQEPQAEGTPVPEPEMKSEEKSEPMPEQKTYSMPEQKAESTPEQKPEPKPEKPDAE